MSLRENSFSKQKWDMKTQTYSCFPIRNHPLYQMMIECPQSSAGHSPHVFLWIERRHLSSMCSPEGSRCAGLMAMWTEMCADACKSDSWVHVKFTIVGSKLSDIAWGDESCEPAITEDMCAIFRWEKYFFLICNGCKVFYIWNQKSKGWRHRKCMSTGWSLQDLYYRGLSVAVRYSCGTQPWSYFFSK